MKSICIKTNNEKILDYLLNELYHINLDNIFLSKQKFKYYENIIIHYKGNSNSLFYHKVSNILTKTIINSFEQNLLKSFINLNYFYFDTFEKNQIFFNSLILLKDKETSNIKYDLLNNAIYQYLLQNHNFYLHGFVNFRLPDYIQFLNEQVDTAVNKFLIDKEYSEFVNLLKLYIHSESSNSDVEHLHLIYNQKNSIIIDDNKNIVSCNSNIAKSKYVSDISFSSNDYALNTLLNLLPKQITIHLVDDNQDEFISTLKIIFEDKISLCNDCDICNFYRNHSSKSNYFNR